MLGKFRVMDALISVGPFAGALTTYGLLVDDLQDDWFAYVVLKYIFAAVAALCVMLALRMLGQRFSAAPAIPRATETVPAMLLARTDVNRDNSPFTIFANTTLALQDDIRTGVYEGRATYGWSQYLGDTGPPTAVGTAYGLRMALALDIRGSAINYGRLVGTLLELQRPGGGWAASTQRGIGRPEVTALVLGAACRVGLDEGSRIELVKVLERLAGAEDPVGMNRTSGVASIVTTLADTAPASALLPDLAGRLARAASPAGSKDSPGSWGEVLRGGTRGSVPHTARAVVALKKAARVLPNSAHLESAANAGISWLVADGRSLTPTDEQMRRPLGGVDVDVLVTGHFTAAWTARAIMSADDPYRHHDALKRVMRAVLEPQRSGVWCWHDDAKPVWMTYQGISTIRDYLLRGFEWPPLQMCCASAPGTFTRRRLPMRGLAQRTRRAKKSSSFSFTTSWISSRCRKSISTLPGGRGPLTRLRSQRRCGTPPPACCRSRCSIPHVGQG